ncbi:HYR domain-containing protein [Abyssalbus ytuae]|uniref:HYR domain-containing protein n=1 Tax=Abyssalbus ytuae TaxID=2926907 RepID=A0A9E6ZTD7_9FLAO|nr:HYR domain-containing protein [Abyssalbus ytuae]UOB18513.1 HYR domain-containing protein [Abyssalbus ytuae]
MLLRSPFYKITLLIIVCMVLGLTRLSAQQLYPSSLDITTLNGNNGFRIPGIDPESQFGAETKFIGDINNDGFDDIALGVNNADINGLDLAGAAYIIFGSNMGLPAVFDINTLDGTNGFAVEGIAGSTRMGDSVEGLGDINGDGIDDLAIVSSGDTMIIYGKTIPFNATFNIDYADGTNGFLIQGANTANEIANLGDINGDNINDFAIGRANFSRAVWVIFGRLSNFPNSINESWLDGANGFGINRYSNSSIPGFLVGGAGDINNDGIDDMIIGDWSSGAGTQLERTHLLYGRNTFTAQIDLETSPVNEVFTIDHTGGNFLAFTGTLGDINDDGIDDFFSERSAIFGKEVSDPFPSHIPLSSVEDGTYGFILPGGLTSASIGDINQDGINDFISVYASLGLEAVAFVIFGSTTGFPDPINETTLDGTNGFIIPGFRTSNIGRPASGGGDFNGDGISDFIVGSPGETPVGSTERTGEAYVIFGGDHYAMPLNTGYPQAINETTTGFTLVVNGPETGTIHYAVYPGNFSGSPIHDEILNGTGAVLSDNFLMNTANTDIQEVITSLASDTTYDVYLFLEDAAGNQGIIYHLNNITTLPAADTTTPTISCIADQELPCGTVTIPDYTGMVTATDDTDPNPVITQNPAAGSAFTAGMTITLTATDASGNESIPCTFIINQTADTQQPDFTCLADQTLSAGSVLPDYTSMVSVTDNCDASPVVTQSPVAGSAFTDGMSVTITATDASGNARPCTFIVNQAADTTTPTISCIADQELPCGTVTIPDYTGMVTATDDTDPNPVIIQNPAAGSAFTAGMTITLTATDTSGNESIPCTFIINQTADTQQPDFTCLADQTLSAGSVLPDYTSMVSVTDNCDASPVVTQSPVAGSAFTDGMSVTIIATDASGNARPCTFIVNQAADTTTPTISCIADQELPCGTVTIPDYTGMVTATDDTDPNPVITQNPAAGSAFTAGMTITLTATDTSGNESIPCTFIINQTADTQQPDFTCLADQTLSAGSVLPDYTSMVSVTDNCDASPVVTQSPLAGSAFTNGMTVTITATDASGNARPCTFTVNQAADTTDPTISCIADQELPCGTVTIPDYMGMVTATDDTDPNPVITQNPAAGSAFTAGMTITLTATDISGNVDECTFTIEQETLPHINAGSDVTIQAGEEVQLEAFINVNGRFEWQPATGLSNPLIANPVASPEETTVYTVTFFSENGCATSDDITVVVELPLLNKKKYGFSPDNDGINEFWKINGIENYPNNRVQVFNRWGDLIYEAQGYNNTSVVFNGTANRKGSLGAGDLPEGTYFFIIRFKDGERERRTEGFVVIKR